MAGAATAAAAPGLAAAKPRRGRRARPNIVFIVAEDLSPRIGCFGDPLARTPRLDAMAREGVRYRNVFTTAPVCAPSRAALAAGMHQQSIGAQHMRTMGPPGLPSGAGFDYQAVPPAHVKAFPELLRADGYFTTNAYKTDYQFGAPFTIWDVDAPDMFNWRTAPAGQPFFAMINLLITHESYIWPTDMAPSNRVEAAIVARNQRDLAAFPAITDPAAVAVPPFLPDTPAVRRDIARFYDNIAIMDGQVGAILDALAHDGVLDDTIVVWTTDHGDGIPHGKRNVYDAGLKVPLIVRYRDRAGAGTERDDLVSFVDLGPSFLGLAGCHVPVSMHGRRAFGRRADAAPVAVFAAADRMDEVPGKWRSVRTATHQYLVNDMPERALLERLGFRDAMPTMRELWRLHASGGLNALQESQFATPRPREELYDIVADPEQTRNLIADPAAQGVLTQMRAHAAHFRSTVPDWSDESERDMVEHRMWLGMKQPVTEPVEIAAAQRVTLTCATSGASIGYRYAGDPEGRWRLYTGPFARAPAGALTAKAIRYGFKESQPVTSA